MQHPRSFESIQQTESLYPFLWNHLNNIGGIEVAS
jgi:hypothetical protein